MTTPVDPVWPIYTFVATFNLPNGRITIPSMRRMFRAHDPLLLRRVLNGFIAAQLFAERPGKPTLHEQGAELGDCYWRHVDTAAWCLTWFAHETFRDGRTDTELLASFHRYVAAHAGRVLMGADETWRWQGPCSCEHCRARGVAIIDH